MIKKYTTFQIYQFAESKEKDKGNYFLKFNEDGDCCFLGHENGIYSCMIYDIRPGICKSYPDTTIQRQYCRNKKQLYLV